MSKSQRESMWYLMYFRNKSSSITQSSSVAAALGLAALPSDGAGGRTTNIFCRNHVVLSSRRERAWRTVRKCERKIGRGGEKGEKLRHVSQYSLSWWWIWDPIWAWDGGLARFVNKGSLSHQCPDLNFKMVLEIRVQWSWRVSPTTTCSPIEKYSAVK